ncbi:uncharacterized protein LOC109863686 [Pseudomyrmex gracilis]|uniref:uncharacterized protein LOC109863686 n=1 Tax=Pseudomyrmex gracilis TaxID=219809 RepID=UPI00099553EA|nr:uncharacterized protein LOC109863686 [Pseudomyrmex gracilis]
MRRSPLNDPRGNQTYNMMRHTPYSWNSHNKANKGYHSVEDDRNQRCSVNNEQPSEDNFIPLNVSSPVVHYKKQSTNQYTSQSNYNSPNSGWSSYRNNYHVAHGKCNNRYPANKHFGKQFYGNYQKRKGFKGTDNRQRDISAYIHPSFFEDPWENLVKNRRQDETMKDESLSDSVVANLSDSTEKSESQLSASTSLGDSQCNQKCESKSVDTSFELENANVSQTLKIDSSSELEISDVCDDK